MSTLAELLTAAYDETLNSTSPASGVTTRLTRYLNDGVRFILSEPAFARLSDSDGPYQFTTVAGTARYAVPDAVSIIRKISERTNDLTLRAISLDAYRQMEPDPATVSGTPVAYVPIGRVAVNVQPSDASAVFVDSTAAGDTNTAFIEGIANSTVGAITVGGRLFSGSRVMTGTTAVQLPSTISTWTEITDFYLSAVAVGHVTLCEDAEGGTELARIVPGQLRPRYFGFYLWPTPAAAVTYFVDYRREIVDMSNTTDEPPLPVDFHQMLVDYATMREFELKGDTERVLIAKQRFDQRLTRLKYQTQWVADELPVLNSRRRIGHSRLGGQYPADTWTRF